MFARLSLFLKFVLQSDKSKIAALFSPNLVKTALRDPQFPCEISRLYSLLGEKDQALSWLEVSVNNGFINYPFLNKYDPFLEKIRGEERFKKLMERVKHEWESFEV